MKRYKGLKQMLNEHDPSVEDWIVRAAENIRNWEPDIFFEDLRTSRRDAYASIFRSPGSALMVVAEKLRSATVREARPFHIMNIEAPGGCWERGTQINPESIDFTAPSGHVIGTSAYRFVFLVCHAIVADETDIVRHQCNNRACIRPDHMLLGSRAQNVQDEERRKYAGNSPQGRGQAMNAHVPKHLQVRPDPFVDEPLERGDTTDVRKKRPEVQK